MSLNKSTDSPMERIPLTRRELLLGGASVIGGASVLGSATLGSDNAVAAGGEGALPSYTVVPQNQVKLPPNGRSVILIGAGLSGLITACELIDRGFKVTVLEKNASAGGRLRSWREKGFGVPSKNPEWTGHPIEHGTHVLFNFYNNFRDFMGRHGLTARPTPINGEVGGFVFAYADGAIHKVPISHAVAPFHTLPMARNAGPHVPAADAVQFGVRQALASMSFDSFSKTDIAYLDSLSMSEWGEAVGMPKTYVAALMDPLWDMANFRPSSQTSALYYHRFLGAMFGDWKDLYFHQVFHDSYDDSIIEPLRKYIVENGGEVLFNQEVVSIHSSDNRIAGLRTREIDNEWICPVCGEVHDAPGPCRRCSHVILEPISAPAREYHSDEYLLGVDIPSAKKLFTKAPFKDLAFFHDTQNLPTSSVIVVYLWYPRVVGKPGVKSNWHDHFGDCECYMTGGFKYLGTTLNWSIRKKESFKEFDADIIETQIARVEWTQGLDNNAIAMRIHEDMKSLIPGLPDFLDSQVVRWDNFSAMTVGSEKFRPAMFTPLENFAILGDWNELDHNCILMEKVNVNARRAVNHLVEKYQIAGGKMVILPSETPNLIVDVVRKIHSVKGGE